MRSKPEGVCVERRQEIADQVRDDVDTMMIHLKSSRPPSRDLPFMIDLYILPMTGRVSLQRQEIAGQARDDVDRMMIHLKPSRPPSRDLPFMINLYILPMALVVQLRGQEIAGQARDDNKCNWCTNPSTFCIPCSIFDSQKKPQNTEQGLLNNEGYPNLSLISYLTSIISDLRSTSLIPDRICRLHCSCTK